MCPTADKRAAPAAWRFRRHALQLKAFNKSPASAMEHIEQEFDNFFDYCRKQGYSGADVHTICRPLVWQQRCAKAKNWALAILPILAAYLLYSWCDSFAWFVSALGRLLLIQLLSLWNWTPLYNAKCVLERPLQQVSAKTVPRLDKYETEAANCVLCETLELVPTASNVSFSFLEASYLERGLPVIVTDSHASQSLASFLEQAQTKAPDFLTSVPCDVATNLMLNKFFDLELALQKIQRAQPLEKWFLQARNCRFSAVKSSRVFVTRPYYYPLHLEPFYSSWILMSNHYMLLQQQIYLQGLVFVQQLSGHFNIRLRPKPPCEHGCPVVNIRLGAGECLVFSTDLWIFSYATEPGDSKNASIATVLEIDWQF